MSTTENGHRLVARFFSLHEQPVLPGYALRLVKYDQPTLLTAEPVHVLGYLREAFRIGVAAALPGCVDYKVFFIFYER